MNILITGGAGFIGSHLAESWLKDGHSVSIIDDLSTGSLDNLKHLPHPERIEFVKGSHPLVPGHSADADGESLPDEDGDGKS